MIKTTCKEANNRIKEFIISVYNADMEKEYTPELPEATNIKQVCKNIYQVFNEEKAYTSGNEQTAFSDWLQGLPTIINSSDWYYFSSTNVTEILTNLLNYTEQEKEKYCSDELQACKFLDMLIYRTVKSYNR